MNLNERWDLKPTNENSMKLSALVSIFVLASMSIGFLWGLSWSVSETQAKQNFRRSMAMVQVLPPSEVPEMSQASVELALELYGIEVPDNTNDPILDMSLEDRGSTMRSLGGDYALVKVGPAAFESWSILASTLAHEIEVHCRQSFPLIYALDVLGLEGTVIAERQAYQYELENAKRFGLNNSEALLIKNTLDFYYSHSKTTQVSRMEFRPGIQAWFHKIFMSRLKSY